MTTRFQEMIAANQTAHLRRRKASSAIMLAGTGLLTLLALVPLFWIIGYVIYRGGQSLDLSFFTQLSRPLGSPGGGVLFSIEGTVVMTVLACIFAIPPGVLAAFYAAAHPGTPLGVALRFGTDVLAGIPSIVLGLFIYVLVVVPTRHYSALAGSLALAILMVPTIIRTTEEMLKLVPHTLREGSLGLGAPEWKTSMSVVFPAALNGIITGFLLAVARAVGETAPLLFTALGNERYDVGQIIGGGIQAHQSAFAILGRVINQPVDSLPLTLWKYAQQPYPERINQSWGVALLLVLFVLLIEIVARLWIQARKRALQG